MDQQRVLDLFLFLLPAVVTGMVAYYFFRLYFKNENARRMFKLHNDTRKTTMPIRLQAYERMALFLERITPSKLLVRVGPNSENATDYESLLIKTVENEFEHNLSQQIYLSDECWSIIKASKNATIQIIRKVAMAKKNDKAAKLREGVLSEMLDKPSPTSAALIYMKKEVSELW